MGAYQNLEIMNIWRTFKCKKDQMIVKLNWIQDTLNCKFVWVNSGKLKAFPDNWQKKLKEVKKYIFTCLHTGRPDVKLSYNFKSYTDLELLNHCVIVVVIVVKETRKKSLFWRYSITFLYTCTLILRDILKCYLPVCTLGSTPIHSTQIVNRIAHSQKTWG